MVHTGRRQPTSLLLTSVSPPPQKNSISLLTYPSRLLLSLKSGLTSSEVGVQSFQSFWFWLAARLIYVTLHRLLRNWERLIKEQSVQRKWVTRLNKTLNSMHALLILVFTRFPRVFFSPKLISLTLSPSLPLSSGPGCRTENCCFILFGVFSKEWTRGKGSLWVCNSGYSLSARGTRGTKGKCTIL